MKNLLFLICLTISVTPVFSALDDYDPCKHKQSMGRRIESQHPGQEDESLLHDAIEKGDVAKIFDLCASGMDVNLNFPYRWETIGSNAICLRKDTPLTLAVRRGNVDIVRILLDHQADPNKKQNHTRAPLSLTDNPMITRLLLQAGADKNNCGRLGHSLTKKAADTKLAAKLEALRQEQTPDMLQS